MLSQRNKTFSFRLLSCYIQLFFLLGMILAIPKVSGEFWVGTWYFFFIGYALLGIFFKHLPYVFNFDLIEGIPFFPIQMNFKGRKAIAISACIIAALTIFLHYYIVGEDLPPLGPVLEAMLVGFVYAGLLYKIHRVAMRDEDESRLRGAGIR